MKRPWPGEGSDRTVLETSGWLVDSAYVLCRGGPPCDRRNRRPVPGASERPRRGARRAPRPFRGCRWRGARGARGATIPFRRTPKNSVKNIVVSNKEKRFRPVREIQTERDSERQRSVPCSWKRNEKTKETPFLRACAACELRQVWLQPKFYRALVPGG